MKKNIIIIHGEDIVASRKALNFLIQKIKQNKEEVIKIIPKEFSPEKLVVALEPDLFNQHKTIVIENFQQFHLQQQKEIIKIVSNNNTNTNTNKVVIWANKKIKKSLTKKLPGAEDQFFKPKAIIFQFLDSLYPQNKINALKLFNQLLQKENISLIYWFLIRRVENLIIAQSSHLNLINRQAPWQKQKLVKQASYFTNEKLQNFLSQLIFLDYKQKTGRLNYSFEFGLELLINKL